MASYKRKFGKIYARYVDKIFRFIFLKVGTKETAEDLTAQVFSKGWEKYSQGTKIKNASAYLYQIARAEIANYYRKRAKYQIVSTEALPIIDPGLGPEERQQLLFDLKELRDGLAKINEDYQNVLILRYVDGLSNKEIAKILGKKPGAVRVLVHRALKELKENLKT